MRFRILCLLALALAGCTAPAPPPMPQAPPETACTAKDAKPVAFNDIQALPAGKCVRTRGLAVRGMMFENGAGFARSQAPQGKGLSLALIWQSGEPAALKSAPQFIEVAGTVRSCIKDVHCPSGAALALSVLEFRIIPTAMD